MIAEIKQGQWEIQRRLEDLQKLDFILEKVNQQSELIGREFNRFWNFQMQGIEAECPNTFFLMPGDAGAFNPRNWVSQEYQLYLLCQHPPGPHPVGNGYALRKAEQWWLTIRPWLNHLINFLKFAVPMGKTIGAVYSVEAMEEHKAQLGLLERIAGQIEELPALDSLKEVGSLPSLGEGQEAVGPALRALHAFLKEVDPAESWGGLSKTVTPDGNILWLCDEHRRPYEVKRLVLEW